MKGVLDMAKDDKYHGKNILSYQPRTIFTGKEIKDWVQYHLEHDTSKTKFAKRMKGYLNLDDNGLYILCKDTYTSSARCGDYLVQRAET